MKNKKSAFVLLGTLVLSLGIGLYANAIHSVNASYTGTANVVGSDENKDTVTEQNPDEENTEDVKDLEDTENSSDQPQDKTHKNEHKSERKLCSEIDKIIKNEPQFSDEGKKKLLELCQQEEQDTSEDTTADNEGDTINPDLAPLVPVSEGSAPTFSDTDPNSLEGEAVKDLHERGLVKGFEDGTFRGKDLVHRGQALKMLLVGKFGNVEDVVTPEDRQKALEQFSDLGENEWSTPYFVLGEKLKVIKGFGDRTVKPNEPVTTEQFLKMMAKVYGLPSNLPHHYTDVTDSDWVNEWAGIAEKYTLFPERTGNLQPQQYLTRKDVVVALHQYFTYTE